MDTTKQFTVSPRARGASVERTVQAIEVALRSAPGSRLVSIDKETGVAVIELPVAMAPSVRQALISDFMVDPNAPLHY